MYTSSYHAGQSGPGHGLSPPCYELTLFHCNFALLECILTKFAPHEHKNVFFMSLKFGMERPKRLRVVESRATANGPAVQLELRPARGNITITLWF